MYANELGLRPAGVTWREYYGMRLTKWREEERAFEEFTVDGRALRVWFPTASDEDITPLSTEGPTEAANSVGLLAELLGLSRATYDDGCSPILICGVDEDLCCGALGVNVSLEPDAVRWRFGWHLLEGDGGVQGHREPEPPEPGGFVFDRGSYETLLRRAQEHCRAVAGDTPATGWMPASDAPKRRNRWPWRRSRD